MKRSVGSKLGYGAPAMSAPGVEIGPQGRRVASEGLRIGWRTVT